MNFDHYYQVGGSLESTHPTYITRRADTELLEFLKAGEYCCVFNSRQTGKSSLRVQTLKKLRVAGIKCASIDLTLLGNHVSPKNWYSGFAYQVLFRLELQDRIKFDTWWQQQSLKTDIQKLIFLIESILFEKIKGNIVIFIDEIDSIIGFDFKDDFFAF